MSHKFNKLKINLKFKMTQKQTQKMIRLNKMMIICLIQMKILKKQKKNQNYKIQAKNFGKMVTNNKH